MSSLGDLMPRLASCLRPSRVRFLGRLVVLLVALPVVTQWIWRMDWEGARSLTLPWSSFPIFSDAWRVWVGSALLLGTIPAASFGWNAARLWWAFGGGLGLFLTAGPTSSWDLRLLLWSGFLIFAHFRDHPVPAGLSAERFATREEIRPYLVGCGAPELDCAIVVGTVWRETWWQPRARWVAFRPTRERPQVGHGLVVAPTGLGKGLALVTQLLASTGHSAIVLDLKGEAYRLTSGARAKAGHRIFRLDLSGPRLGHRYDPTAQAQEEDDLRVIAQALTHDSRDRDPFWAYAAEEMLTTSMLAARAAKRPVFPFLRVLLDHGMKGAQELVHAIDPALAARLLPGGRADSKLMLGVWTTLVARLRPLLTDRVLAVFEGSDFTAADLRGERTTVYITVPEAHLERLAPALAAVWTGLIGALIAHADANTTAALRPLLLMLDEAGRIPLPRLPGYLATLRSRGVTCLVYVQSFSQLRHAYGPEQADSISNNCALQIYYQQHDEATAWAASRRLGETCEFARGFSVTEAGVIPGVGRVTRTATERPRPLLSPQEVLRLPERSVLVFYRDLLPLWIGRLDWREHRVLCELATTQPVDLPALEPWMGTLQHSSRTDARGAANDYVDPQ